MSPVWFISLLLAETMKFDFRQLFVFLVCASSLISKVFSWFETFSYTGWKLKAGSTRYARDKLECMAQCYRKHGGNCGAASYKDSTYRCRITKDRRPIITRDAQQTLYLHTPTLEGDLTCVFHRLNLTNAPNVVHLRPPSPQMICKTIWTSVKQLGIRVRSKRYWLNMGNVRFCANKHVNPNPHSGSFTTTDHVKAELQASQLLRIDWYVSNYNVQANLDILKLMGLIFYKFKLPEVQIDLHFG